MKELEQKVAQTAQHESLRLRAVEQECHRLRETLAATKTRILGLTTTLSGIADNIDASLDSLTETIEVALSKDHSENQDGAIQDHAEGGRVNTSEDVEGAERTSPHADHTEPLPDLPGPGERNEGLGDAQDIPSTEQQHCIGVFDGVSWNDGQQHSDLISSNSLLSSTGLIEPVIRTQPSSSHTYTGYITQETTRWPLNGDQSEPTPVHLPFFSSGSPDESLKFPLMNIGFPPGMASFPSVFSAHLAVCEYFTKQNQAYRDRLQPNGVES